MFGGNANKVSVIITITFLLLPNLNPSNLINFQDHQWCCHHPNH
jgi:hypothetical protein